MISTRSSATPLRSPARAVLGAALAVGALSVLTGCGAGQVNTIGDEVSAVNGATGHIGQIDVLDAIIANPPGDARLYQPHQSASLYFTVSNSGLPADKLVSISTPAARSVTLQGALDIPGGTSVVAAGPGETSSKEAAVTATLEGLTRVVEQGPTVPVTFTFARAGAVTLPLPVGVPAGPFAPS